MKEHKHVSNAKAIVALLILAIAFVIFYKFAGSQAAFNNDPLALRNYVVFAIVGAGFLIGLLYLSSNTTHKAASKSKSVSKSSKSKKKKK